MQGVEAVDELAARMKALSGVKRKHCSTSYECSLCSNSTSNYNECNCKEFAEFSSTDSFSSSKKMKSDIPSTDENASSNFVNQDIPVKSESTKQNETSLFQQIHTTPTINQLSTASSVTTSESPFVFPNSHKRTGNQLFEEEKESFFLDDLEILHSSKKLKQMSVHQTEEANSIDSN